MKVLISGISGKMGQLLKTVVDESNNFEFAGGFDIASDAKITNDFDVIIDFSHYSQTLDLISLAKNYNKPLVIATTGLKKEQLEAINEAAKNIPIFMSSNYSYGVTVMNKVLDALNKLLLEYDVEIIEKHHRYKKDAPSGTALMLYNTVKDNREDSEMVRDYKTQRTTNDIGVHALRGGTIFGEHEVIFAGEDEIISIKHEALSRRIFVNGALRAASFIITKQTGLYNMEDLV